MGLLDILNKAKDSAMAAKDKAVQYVKDNIQMREEASEEAKAWKTFDPKMLKAILNDNVSRAIDLYVKQTGASPEKARMLVNKISDSVKEEYPAILHEEACEADMQAIKDVWPFGSKVFNMYNFTKDKKGQCVTIFSGQLQSNGNGEYQLTANCQSSKDISFSWNAVFKNNKLYLKDESGNVTVADSFVVDLNDNLYLVFDPKDERYKRMATIVNPINHIKTLHLYRESDLKKVKDGKMDEETLGTIADKFTFKFKNDEIRLTEVNIGEIFKDEFFNLSKKNKQPYILQQETYEYIHNYGVRYAPDDEDFQRQWRHFYQIVHPNKADDMTRELWNIKILGEAGMIYKGLRKLIEQGTLPYKLDSVVWDNEGILYSFKIEDTFFDYFLGITDERPLINRIAGTVDEYTERMLTHTEEMQKIYQKMIRVNLKSIEFTLYFDSEKNVIFNGLGYTLGGFFDDVEFYSPSNKKKITFETFANHINSSEPIEEKISEPTEEKISEPTGEKNVDSSDESADSQWEESSIFELLEKKEYFKAVKRYSQMYKVKFEEASVRLADYMIKHPDRFSNDSPNNTSEDSLVKEPIVKLYSFVKYRDCKTKKEHACRIVPKEEYEFTLGTRDCSVDAPLGTALMGKSKGAIVIFDAPGGTQEREILDVW